MPTRHEPASRPPHFSYRNQQLHCEDIPAERLAGEFGTPLYVYSESMIRERYAAMDEAFRAIPHTICYSVKANSNLAVLKLLAEAGAGFDIVSGGELERVRKVARTTKSIVFSGVGKTAAELDAALLAGILLFNVESESELCLLSARAARLQKTAPVALRVNPDVAAKTHPYISTGLREHKFGVDMASALPLYRLGARLPGLKIAGVSAHIGSQIQDVHPFGQAVARLAALVRSLRREGITVQYLDVGGGMGIDYDAQGDGDFRSVLSAYAKAVMTPLAGLGIHLLLEPGRSIVGPAGVLLTRVIVRKRNGRKQFVIVDAGMNDLIRPALYQAHHEIVPTQTRAQRKRETVDVVGPVCESGDFLAQNRRLQEVEEGELLAVLDAGAYGMSLASNYNSRPRPAEVMVSGKRAHVIRKRETLKDLLEQESE
jgi:diaminopimelate decarboxylase